MVEQHHEHSLAKCAVPAGRILEHFMSQRGLDMNVTKLLLERHIRWIRIRKKTAQHGTFT